MEPPGRVTRRVQRVVARSSRGPLGRVWGLGYRAASRAASAYLLRGEHDPAVYGRSGTGGDETIPGISDIDLAFVVATDPGGPGVAAYRVRDRYERFAERWPLATRLVDRPAIFDEEQLADVAGRSYLTYGLRGPGVGSAAERRDLAVYGRRRLLERPGLEGEPEAWRLLRGPDRRPGLSVRDDQEERIASWLELCHLWRFAVELAAAPDRPYAASLCVKLVAEPARIWLWLTGRERVGSRQEALERLGEALPAEAEAARAAAELADRLYRLPDAPVESALATFVRLSTVIADEVSRQAFDPGAREVRLAGVAPVALSGPVAIGVEEIDRSALGASVEDADVHRHPEGALPLCDWSALAIPTWADESLLPIDADPGRSAELAAAAAKRRGPVYPVLRHADLLVLPTLVAERPMARRLGCRASDPVSLAVLDGVGTALFPEVTGWSIADTARRAVTEQRERLRAAAPRDARQELASLLAAARSALVHESAQAEEPVIPVTLAATAELLAETVGGARGAADAARESLLDETHVPSASLASALRSAVEALPAFAPD